MSWPLFSNDAMLDLDGCFKRCYKCESLKPVGDFDIKRKVFGRTATQVSLWERCEQCRHPAEDDSQGELKL